MATNIQQIFRDTNFLNEQHVTLAGLLHAGNVVERHVTKTMEDLDLPLSKYRVLRGLRKVHPNGLGVYRLRDFLIGEKSDISRLVEKMVQRGLVERTTDPHNKSISQIVISEHGLQKVGEMDKHIIDIIEPVMCLSDQEARQLNTLLGKILAAFPDNSGHEQTA